MSEDKHVNKAYRIIQVLISEPEESEEHPGLFITKLTHPALVGELSLSHGIERENLLKAICVEPKDFDPVSTLFLHIAELRKQI